MLHIPAPGCLGGELSDTAFCLCKVDGRSFRRNDVVRLNGDDSCNFSNPLNEPCLTNISFVAFGR